jgi:MFS family permease
MTMPPDARRVLLARSLRAFGDGYVAVLLPVHLAALGLDAFAIGAISTATLLGSALLTIVLGHVAHRLKRRHALVAAGALMAATGAGFAVVGGFWPLLVIAFVGTINPSSGDVSVFQPIENTVLAETVAADRRTAIFARYAFTGAISVAAGALTAGSVDWLAPLVAPETTIRALFVLYGAAGLANLALYRRLSPKAELSSDRPAAPLGPSRRHVYKLAALFSIDSFGGGLMVNSLLALWLFQRFGLAVSTAAQIFFVMGACAAVSYFAAVPLSRRFGLINTMVFTHLPANAFMVMAAFAPTLGWVFALLVLRSLLSQMDVPARTSYVMATVTPEERPAAASLAAVPRSLASAVAPLLSGWLLGLSVFGWPLVLGGGLKMVYDLALLRAFAHVKPPEETRRPEGGGR